MIEFDYKIVRDEADEKKTYVPSIQKKLDNLVYIEGPNSSGKSTLLHILALALFGLKNKTIRETLQRKLKDLMGAEHQKISFSLRITDPRTNLELFAEKKSLNSPELTVYEIANSRKQILTAELFERKYKLVYDIPEDPTERLDELTDDLKSRQESIGRRISSLKMLIRDVIREVQNSRDPEKLKRFRQELSEMNGTIRSLTEEKANLKNDLDFLRRYYYSRFYLAYLDKTQHLEAELTKERKALKGVEKGEKVVQTRAKDLAAGAKQLLKQIRTTMDELAYTLKWMKIRTKEDYIGVWTSTKLERLFLDKENHAFLFDGIAAFRQKVNDLDSEAFTEEQLQEARLLAELIELLHHYITIKTPLPGTSTSIPDFIQILEEQNKKFKDVKISHDKYLDVLKKLELLETSSRTFLEEYLSELRELLAPRKVPNKPRMEDMEDRIDELKQSLAKAMTKLDYFRDELVRTGVKDDDAPLIVQTFESNKFFKPYIVYDEDDFDKKLLDLKKELDGKAKKLEEHIYHKTRHEHEIERLDQQKQHEYQEHLPQLHVLFDIVQRLEQRLLNEFEGYIKSLSQRIVDSKHLSAPERIYYDSVGTYLAKMLKTIRHIDTDYPVAKIDLVDRVITTQTKKKIFLNDLGTGQGQSAYLKALLSSNDKRMLIALIDEVAMMDKASMKPIHEVLQRRYKSGQLLAGVLVQKGESLSVTSLV